MMWLSFYDEIKISSTIFYRPITRVNLVAQEAPQSRQTSAVAMHFVVARLLFIHIRYPMLTSTNTLIYSDVAGNFISNVVVRLGQCYLYSCTEHHSSDCSYMH